MTYSCKYRNNPSFPYSRRTISKKNIKNFEQEKEEHKETKKEPSSFLDSSFLRSFLDPIERLLGRKIGFDDILLLVLIYILFTEKENNKEDQTLLLCLIFVLMG